MTLILLVLPLLGCGDALSPLQTAPLAGMREDLGRFEGRWFDERGNLIAVVSGGRTPQLGIRLPARLSLGDARLQDGHVLFHVKGDQLAEPVPGALELMGEDNIAMGEIAPPNPTPYLFNCTGLSVIPRNFLMRDPSSLWLTRNSAKRVARLANDTYESVRDGVFDRLSRIL